MYSISTGSTIRSPLSSLFIAWVGRPHRSHCAEVVVVARVVYYAEAVVLRTSRKLWIDCVIGYISSAAGLSCGPCDLDLKALEKLSHVLCCWERGEGGKTAGSSWALGLGVGVPGHGLRGPCMINKSLVVQRVV